MKVKLDENLGESVAEALRRAGHEVATVPSQGLSGIEDGALIQMCRKEERCLVTLDVEFGNPLLFKSADYPGIVVLRLPPRPTPRALLDAVRTLVGGLARESVAGKLWIVQRGRLREYQPEEGRSNG